MQEINISANPFPGLRPFESNETHLFFGRDGQSEELLRRLNRTRFLAVVGTSGSGKSSLVRAGLLPALQGGLMASAGSDWRIAVMRPGSDPIGNLARALAAPNVLGSHDDGKGTDMQAVLAETTLRRGSLGLVELVRRARTKLDAGGQSLFPDYENLLVVVDQFEELFRFKQLIEEANSKEDEAAFVKLLLEAVGQREDKIYVILTMRSDFLGDCSQFWGLPEAINNGQYLIPRMTRDERREAVTGPVAVGQGAISEPLVNQLLNDVGDNPDQLPILQHALMRTWDYWLSVRRDGEPLDIPHYEAIGGMASALSRHADEAYEELTDGQKIIAEKLFKGLTEKGTDNREIRRPMEVQDICELTGAEEASVIAVIEVFRREGRSFLMPPPQDPLTGAPVHLSKDSLIDISHESLIRNWERLKNWVDEESRSARIYRRLAETAVLYKEGGAGLWRDPDLQLALNWRDGCKPNKVWASRYHPGYDEATDFLNASVKEREAAVLNAERQSRAQIRRARVTALVFALAFILACGAVVFAYSKKAEADKQRVEADTQRVKTAEALREVDIQRREAIRQREIAEKQADLARQQSETASQEKDKAEKQEEIARQQELEAEKQALIAKQYAKEARTAALQAKEQTRVAEEQKLVAQGEVKKNRRLIYAADMNLVGQTYELNNLAPGLKFLEDYLQPPEDDDPRGFEWYYFWRLYHQGYVTLSTDPNIVASVAFSPDGKALVTGSEDGTVKLWDAASRRQLASRKGHTKAINSMALSRDGKTLATAGEDGTVKLWDAALSQEPVTLPGNTGTIRSVAFSPDGKTLAAASEDGTVLWDTASRQEPRILKAKGAVLSVAFSLDGKMLATGGVDGQVNLWDTASYQEPVTLGKHTNVVRSLAFSPDGKTLATGGADGTIKLWDTTSTQNPAPQMPFMIKWQTSYVRSLAFSPDGKTLAAVSVERTLKLWDATDPKHPVLAALRGHTDHINSVAFSPDGTLATSSEDGTVILWVKVQPEGTIRPQGPTVFTGKSKVVTVAFSPDGKTVATGSEDGMVKFFDAVSHKELAPDKQHTSPVSSVAFSRDGKMLATGGADGKVNLWDTASPNKPFLLGEQKAGFYSVAFSPVGETLAAGDADGKVKLWDTATRKELATLSGHKGTIRSVAFSPDGKTLATGSDDATVKLWDTAARKELATLSGHTEPVSSVAFSRDGKKIATGSLDKMVKVWETATRKELVTLSGHADVVNSVTFSPDGKRLVTGGVDKMVKFWDTMTYREIAILRGHTGGVYSLAFSRDGKTLATGGSDKTVRLWHTATDAELRPKADSSILSNNAAR